MYDGPGLALPFRFRVCINGIRRPTQASFGLQNSSAYVGCRHCLAYCWGLLPEDAEEEGEGLDLTIVHHRGDRGEGRAI